MNSEKKKQLQIRECYPCCKARRGYCECSLASPHLFGFPRFLVCNAGITAPCSLLLSLLKQWRCLRACSSCLTLCDPMDCSPPGSSVRGILQAGILEWAAIPFSRESSQPRDWTCVFCIGRWVLYPWATWEARVMTLIGKRKVSNHLLFF